MFFILSLKKSETHAPCIHAWLHPAATRRS
jgi:hypothetical protein